MSESDDYAILHIHAQIDWHSDAVIVGNRSSLKSLRDALDKALKSGKGTAQAMVTDGEGYDVEVILRDVPWDHKQWNEALLPYSADYACGDDKRQI